MPRPRRSRPSWAFVSSLTLAVVLGACSSASPSAGTASSAAGSAAGSSQAGAASSARTIDVTVKGTSITPAPATIPLKVGETINVVVTSDHDDEVHAHGFEVEKEVKAGVPVTLQLTGDVPGVYEVELHHPALTLLQIAVS